MVCIVTLSRRGDRRWETAQTPAQGLFKKKPCRGQDVAIARTPPTAAYRLGVDTGEGVWRGSLAG
jgi:hypothetical protein